MQSFKLFPQVLHFAQFGHFPLTSWVPQATHFGALGVVCVAQLSMSVETGIASIKIEAKNRYFLNGIVKILQKIINFK